VGTSQSKRDPRPEIPLIPPWADSDPPPQEPDSDEQSEDNNSPLAPPRRFQGFRIQLTTFASSGRRSDARQALSRWASTSSGGSAVAPKRVARAIAGGAAALGAIARADAGLPAETGLLDLRSLAGQPLAIAINTIVDTFCPPGILDEEIARMALGEALASALSEADTFEPTAFPESLVPIAILAFVAELTFAQVATDIGDTFVNTVSPIVAAKREAELKSLVKEVADMVGPPIIAAAGALVNRSALAKVIRELVRVIHATMESWE
jgi:hypothetical protein